MGSGELNDINNYRLRIVESMSIVHAKYIRDSDPSRTLGDFVKRKMAMKIGEYILNKTAEITVVENVHTHTYDYKAEFYAVPLKAIETVRVPVYRELVQPPPDQVFSIESLMRIFDDAYNVSFMNPNDQLPPERRGMMAVLEYISQRF